MNDQLLAQRPIDIGGVIQGIGPLGFQTGSPTNAPDLFTRIISSAIGIMTIVAGIWFIFVFITGAYGIISSGGEKGAYEAARKKMMTGLIGLVVVISTVFIIDFVGWIVGFDILNITALINQIGI